MKIKQLKLRHGWLYLLLALSVTVPCMASSKIEALHNPIDIQIIADDGQIFPIYPVTHLDVKRETRAYLEAINGKNYSIQIRNHTNQRIGLVIAVDGRNIISGKKSNLKRSENMYVLGPYETQHYAGWRTSSNDIHRFYFTEIEESYAHAFGDDSAMGVIAVAVYEEKHSFFSKRNKIFKPTPQSKSKAPNRSNDSASSNEAENDDRAETGTGFGDHQISHVRRVQFTPKRKATIKSFYKYEWRETLCNQQIIDCRYKYKKRKNRFWSNKNYELGYAPYPPGY